MEDGKNPHDEVGGAVIDALREALQGEPGPIADGENVFTKFNLDSMTTIKVLSSLEVRFDIVIGQDLADFEMMRSFSGLKELVRKRTCAPAGALVKDTSNQESHHASNTQGS